MSRNTKAATFGALVLIFALLVPGCGPATTPAPAVDEVTQSVDEEGATATEQVVLTATSEPEATEKPTEDVFRLAVAYGEPSPDPHITAGSWTGDFLVSCAYQSLVRMEGTPRKPEMLLAESYEKRDDLTEWTFHLREDAVFHDGTPVTAEDVRYSWARVMTLKQGYAYLWLPFADADSAKVIDDYTISFELNGPFADFLTSLSSLPIVNSDLVRSHQEEGDYGDEGDYGQAWMAEGQDAGSGPYIWEDYEPGTQHVFQAVEDYWFGWPNPKHMDTVIVKVIPELGTQKLALTKGEIDWAGDLSVEDYKELLDTPGVEPVQRLPNVRFVLFMNNQQGPTSDVNVRKAIAYSFDYDAMLDTVIGEKCVGLFPGTLEGTMPLEMPEYDIEKAKEYLAESPWPDGGFEVTFNYLHESPEDLNASLILKEGLDKLNIKLNLVPTPWTECLAMCQEAETAPMIQSSDQSPEWTMWMTLDSKFNSAHWGSFTLCTYYRNEEVDRLIKAAAGEPDEEKRKEMYAEIQRLVADDMPYLSLYDKAYRQAHVEGLKGVDLGRGLRPYPHIIEKLYYED
jgi:peptide/nickel transport system substrate-binding protein